MVDSNRWRHWLFLTFVIFVSHGLVLISGRIIWDGFWIIGMLERGETAKFMEYCREIGLPMIGYFDMALMKLPYPEFSCRLLGFVTLFINAIIIKQLLSPIRMFSPAEKWLIVYISAAYHGFQVLGDITSLWHSLCYTTFLVAAFIWQSHELKPEIRRSWMLVLSGFLFFLSFNLNSLLILYYILPICLAGFRTNMTMGEIRSTAARFALNNKIFLLLPILFWIGKEVFTPRIGANASYNRLILDPVSIAKGTYYAYYEGIIAKFRESASVYGGKMAVVALLLFVVSAFIVWRILKEKESLQRVSFSQSLRSIIVVILIYGAGCAGFILVGKGKEAFATGWSSRGTLLVSAPIAVLFILVLRQVAALLAPDIFRRAAATIVLSFFVAGFIANNIASYFYWEAETTKEESLRMHLAKSSKFNQASIVYIEDSYIIPQAVAWYPPVVWTYLLAWKQPKISHFAFMVGPGDPRKFTPDFLEKIKIGTTVPQFFPGVDMAGPQARFAVSKKTELSDLSVGARSLWYKMTNPRKYEVFATETLNVVYRDTSKDKYRND